MIEFEVILSQSCKQNSYKEMLKLWFKSKPMGTFECMRIELELRYGAEQFWVTSFDGKKIDCMIVPA